MKKKWVCGVTGGRWEHRQRLRNIDTVGYARKNHHRETSDKRRRRPRGGVGYMAPSQHRRNLKILTYPNQEPSYKTNAKHKRIVQTHTHMRCV